ncbi:uncharacterized [Tachysurus ichikawai]
MNSRVVFSYSTSENDRQQKNTSFTNLIGGSRLGCTAKASFKQQDDHRQLSSPCITRLQGSAMQLAILLAQNQKQRYVLRGTGMSETAGDTLVAPGLHS